MTFNHLSDGEFEELTYELLKSLGFTNLSWRRGSGLGGATADQGRDIVAKRLEEDVDGHKRLETWFVQCKRYERGVPPEKLQGAIAWATAERPAVLLFVISNFLSNSAKAWLQQLEISNTPSFRIKVWERKDIEAFVVSRPILATRFRINIGDGLTGIHPAHAAYVRRPSYNTLKYFLALIDKIEPQQRDKLFSWGYWNVINPLFKDPVSGEEKLFDLVEPKINYENFVIKCRQLMSEGSVAGNFLVSALVVEALRWSWHAADPTEAARSHHTSLDTIAIWEKELGTETDSEKRSVLEQMIAFTRKMMRTDDQFREATASYEYLCETVLPLLFLEEDVRRNASWPDDDE